MAKKYLRQQSKRLTCRKRYKIEKKVKEHNRKQRKITKNEGGKLKKKAFAIPKSMPFKEAVLKEAEDFKQRQEDLRLERRRIAKELKSEKRSGKTASLAKPVAAKPSVVTRPVHRHERAPPSGSGLLETRVVRDADVVVFVLDARDPALSRCRAMERQVLATGKKVVLLLNKIDLVPVHIVEAWLKVLRKEFPTVPFRAATQSQTKHLGQKRIDYRAESAMKSSRCIGADGLMKLIGNYSRVDQPVATEKGTSKDDVIATGEDRGETANDGDGVANSDATPSIVKGDSAAQQKVYCAPVTVCVVGRPNTGKSSVINSLRRDRACVAGPTAGLTRCVQEVKVNKRIRVLDTPGVVFADHDSVVADAKDVGDGDNIDADQKKKKLSTRQQLLAGFCQFGTASDEDVSRAASEIIRRCPTDLLQIFYNLPSFDENPAAALTLLGRRLGLRRGGRPDVRRAARRVLDDWISGRIRHYRQPPAPGRGAGGDGESAVVAAGPAQLLVQPDAATDRRVLTELSHEQTKPTGKTCDVGDIELLMESDDEDGDGEFDADDDVDSDLIVDDDSDEVEEEEDEEMSDEEAEEDTEEEQDGVEADGDDLVVMEVDDKTAAKKAVGAGGEATKQRKKKAPSAEALAYSNKVTGGEQRNRVITSRQKALRKKALKKARRSQSPNKSASSQKMNGNDAYDFADHFSSA